MQQIKTKLKGYGLCLYYSIRVWLFGLKDTEDNMAKELTEKFKDFHNELVEYLSQQDTKDYNLNMDLTLNFVILLRQFYRDMSIYQIITMLKLCADTKLPAIKAYHLLSKNIVDEVYKKLDEIYNHRKQKKGLVSCHNTLINSLKKDINKWYKKQVEWENTQADSAESVS